MLGVQRLEAALRERPWIAGSTFSLADINGFNLCYGLPMLQRPVLASDAKTPALMEWLRKIYERPATQKTWAMGRTEMAKRVTYLKRP